MNWTTFLAMLARDAHVARRRLVQLALQTLLQPMLFVFIFGRVMTSGGLLSTQYKSLLLPGIMAISMMFAGIWAVAMPLLAEFQFTREIEDRLLAPMDVEWLAIEKIVAGMAQALVAGLVVVPIGYLVMGAGVSLDLGAPLRLGALALMVAALSASVGLTLGSSVSQQGIGLMFSLVLTPMIFFGCAYYPWSTLAPFPVLQYLVLLNPMVYASEGFRSALVPQSPHLPLPVIFGGLAVFDLAFVLVGLRLFLRKAIG
ncbi:MAG: ABC transporter permease [Vicinamibacterales bacterium]